MIDRQRDQIEQEIEQEQQLLDISRKRLHELDRQATAFGYSTEPVINMERTDLAAEIARREQQLQQLLAQRAHYQEQDEAMTATAVPAQQPAAQQQTLRDVVTGLVQQLASLGQQFTELAQRVRAIEDRAEADGRTLAELRTAQQWIIALLALNLALGLTSLILVVALATR